MMPTGTGKTTQMPQLLYQAGWTRRGKVLISVPTRDLAAELAGRVAEEMGVPLGTLVGYEVRGEKETSQHTQIIFMTEGVLRGKIQRNPMLSGVSAILLDEFHNRSLLSDFNAALIERAQNEGAKVVMVFMSATIDPSQLALHFNCPVVDGSGLDTTYPIEQRFMDRAKDIYAQAAEFAWEMVTEGRGNGLIFMPGKAEIELTIDALHKIDFPRHVRILPLHGDLEPDDRHAPFEHFDGVTITVATNIVETGATLRDIGWVCDSGLARETSYDPVSDISTLGVVKIAQDRIKQRMGRCGRVREGIYGALFSTGDYLGRAKHTLPEIFRVPLRQIVLTIKALKLTREESPLRLIDNPDKPNWKNAKNQLRQFGFASLDESAKITELGLQAVELGCDPREAAMLLAAAKLDCAREMSIVIAAMQSKRLLIRPKNRDELSFAAQSQSQFLTSSTCDGWTAVRVVRLMNERDKNESMGQWCKRNYISYRSLREVLTGSRQLLSDLRQVGVSFNNEPGTEDQLRRAMFAGLKDRVFRYSYGDYTHTEKLCEDIELARESVVKPMRKNEYVAAAEILQIPTARGMLRLNTNAVVIDQSWL
jgi:ATP-dependent helicase HrpA